MYHALHVLDAPAFIGFQKLGLTGKLTVVIT